MPEEAVVRTRSFTGAANVMGGDHPALGLAGGFQIE